MKRTSTLLALTLFLTPALAMADAHDDARRRFKEGSAAFEHGSYAAAADAFADVYRTTGETKHLWNLALAEVKAERSFDALQHLREYVAKPDANPTNVARANGLMTELAPKVAHVTVVAPAEADVLVDGARIGAAPLTAPVELDPAKPHEIIARHGIDEAKQALAAPGAKDLRVELAFPVVPAPTPAPIAATAPPAAPLSDAEPPATEHHKAPLRIWMTVGLGVGAAALAGVGVYEGIQSNNASSTATSLRAGMPNSSWCSNPSAANCAALQSASSSQGSDHTASMLLLGGAGVFAAGAIVSWFALPRESATTMTATPLVGPHLVGAAWSRSF